MKKLISTRKRYGIGLAARLECYLCINNLKIFHVQWNIKSLAWNVEYIYSNEPYLKTVNQLRKCWKCQLLDGRSNFINASYQRFQRCLKIKTVYTVDVLDLLNRRFPKKMASFKSRFDEILHWCIHRNNVYFKGNKLPLAKCVFMRMASTFFIAP